ncbi:TetR/AcrR family transcriptional regulator [Maritimibacter sp. UBA3975]|uniref:TetR/AcrR family transcriptional regulator n=1 Tax=Maritimibacter sp. UBA3975 TaxID=1946833 RepID=UPI000C0987F1|nr:TetR/AcrR family transcriptional regulator [Maritimibacter sp. UBA3975]MAM61882.1 TetR family transcriptional regulator [Maritimibacter sp.]|tara:strand:+ start:3312 stop:3929 length:618 start_codon:yes stop_codon:yes gene_type:complete
MSKTRRTRSRERILAAAQDVFLAEGYHGTAMDVVTQAAGVSKQTVYAHFPSKEALFRDVIASMTAGAVAAHRARVGDFTGQQPVADFLEHYAREQLAIVLTPRLMALRRLVIGEANRFPDLGRHLFDTGPGASLERLTQAMEGYGAQGDIVVSQPHEAAKLFNWMVMGGPTAEIMHMGDSAIPEPDWCRAHAAECTRVFLAAYAP